MLKFGSIAVVVFMFYVKQGVKRSGFFDEDAGF